jgi:hypothetical protein
MSILIQVSLDNQVYILTNILQKKQTLKLFTEINKTEIFYKSYKNAKLEGLVDVTKWSD